jgi:hypothetical protein
MSKGLRRFLFYVSILVFIAGATAAALYALGWRLDWETFEPQKVGAIYLRSFPPGTTIVLDGEPVKNKTGFFQAGTLINSLYPKNYSLKLAYPGFRDWERSVQVEPALVTEAKYAVLVPNEAIRVIEQKVKNFWLLDEEPLVQDETGKLILQNQVLPGTNVLGWTSDFARILTKDQKTGTYYWNDLRNATSSNISAALRRTNPRFASTTEISVEAENTTQLLLHTSSSVALFDLQRSVLSPIASTTITSSTRTLITDAAISRFWISWSEYRPASGTSQIYLYDKFFGTKRVLDPLPGRTMEMKWSNNVLGFHQDNGKFYYHTPGAEKPTHLADDVRYFEFTPGADMVATIGGQNLEVFSLKDKDDYWRYDRIPEVKKIAKLGWFRDGQHIFISYPGNTVFLELDDLGLENLEAVAPTDKAQYDASLNEFYYIDNGALMKLVFPK